MELPDKKSLDKEIQCPLCNQLIILNVKSEDIRCNYCNKNFIYKYCPECTSIIFFQPMYYDGYNIKCPYISCRSISCSVKCIKCNKKIFFTNGYKYFQGDTIECKDCNLSFKKVKCPSLYCDKSINIHPKDNFFEGKELTCDHQGTIFRYQKVGCWFCGRHCVWDNTKGKKYIEGQEIICPYKECERVTNKVTCPKCFASSYITKANLEMGKKINCFMKNCNNTYNVYFCPYCKETNYGDGSPVAGLELKCSHCHKSFYFVNCFYCKQINFWTNSKKYIPGQTVVCSNKNCTKKSALMQCIYCKKTNHFTKGVFTLGKEYACSYKECKKEFIILYCGNCNTTHIKDPNVSTDILYKCDICLNEMPTVQCPKCNKFCSPFSKLDNCAYLKCPYNSCGQEFYYYKCPSCKRDFNTINNSSNVKCPFKNCNETFSCYSCKKCSKARLIKGSNMDIENFNCEYCNENNEISENLNPKIIIQLKKANIIQGDRFVFDNPEEDPYDRKIIDSLIPTKLYEMMGRRIIREEEEEKEEKNCVVCLTNKIEWIIAPCGHKCLCPECGKQYKQPNKKCPICKENIIGILEKVIDD